MHTLRLILISLLILTIVFAYDPITREQVIQGWESARPTVVALMDGLYALVRTLIVGDGRHDRIDDTPVSPGGDFDRIVTMNMSRLSS
jgi:hypothetical protein